MKYFDIFAESGFHSAFLTTYAFGAQAFEDVPFSRLRGSGCRNIVILADRQMANQSFAEGGTSAAGRARFRRRRRCEEGPIADWLGQPDRARPWWKQGTGRQPLLRRRRDRQRRPLRCGAELHSQQGPLG